MRRRLCCSLAFLLGLSPSTALAQRATPSVPGTGHARPSSIPVIAVLEDSSRRLEILGLKRWTLAMIQDSLARYAPHDSLLSHACAAILRGKLHFADAAVTYAPQVADGKEKELWFVSVMEPQDSALVRFRPDYRDTLALRPEWAPIRDAFDHGNHAFQRVIQKPRFMYGDSALRAEEFRLSDSVFEIVLPMRAALRKLRSPSAVDTALAALDHDGRWENRMAAVVVLGQDAVVGRAAAWRALVSALRDPTAMVWATAEQVLSGVLAQGPAPSIDWAPSVTELRAFLDGTNVYVYDRVLQILTATRVSPALASPLLRGGGQLLLAKLSSSYPGSRQAAHAFLVQIAGRDLGDDPLAWQAWIGGL